MTAKITGDIVVHANRCRCGAIPEILKSAQDRFWIGCRQRGEKSACNMHIITDATTRAGAIQKWNSHLKRYR